MRILLNEMMQCVSAKAYYPALITAVTIPDICAALDSNGSTKPSKYIKWFEANAAKYFQTLLDGRTAYYLRCSVLHQGRLSLPQSKHSFDIMFVTENSGMSIHLISIVHKGGKEFLVLELNKFCQAIYNSAIDWLRLVEESDNFKNNYKKFFKENIQPLPWDEEGVSIIASF
jgi:hypothetical protein